MEYSDLLNQATALEERIVGFRRTLHQYPELSFEEHQTAAFIVQTLQQAGIPFTRVANTGILARIDGTQPHQSHSKNKLTTILSDIEIASPSCSETISCARTAAIILPEVPQSTGTEDAEAVVVLRADIDALPIQEQTDLPFASKNPGVMHACGHDLHTAALLGTLLLLHQNRAQIQTPILGLFQPGEEQSPGGASLVLQDPNFTQYAPEVVIGQHVAAELEVGKFGFRSGMYMASADEVHITLSGTGGHGALPQTLTDPVLAMAQLIVSLQQVVSRSVDPKVPTVLSFGGVEANGRTNIIPAEVRIQGTLRTLNENARETAKKRICQIAQGVALESGVAINVDFKSGYPAVINDPKITRKAQEIALNLFGNKQIETLDLRMTAEDFGFYAQKYPAVFYRFGVASPSGTPCGNAHTPTFNPDDKALKYSMALLTILALNFSHHDR